MMALDLSMKSSRRPCEATAGAAAAAAAAVVVGVPGAGSPGTGGRRRRPDELPPPPSHHKHHPYHLPPAQPQEEAPIDLVVGKKRVRFQASVRLHAPHQPHHHQHSHPYLSLPTKALWRPRLASPASGDSDEENRPPSTASTSSLSSTASTSSSADWDSRLSGTRDITQDSRQMSLHPATRTAGHVTTQTGVSADVRNVFLSLPSDPRDWSRADVANWLVAMKTLHALADLRPDRFLMNGKALCLMNAAMFAYRVPVGGKLLYRDFRVRLARAIAASQSATAPDMTSSPAVTTSRAVAPPTRA